MNAYEILQEVRDYVGEAAAANWTDLGILRKINANYKRVGAKLVVIGGDWLLKKSAALTPVDGLVTLPSDCAKPVYIEDVSTGTNIPFNGSVRYRNLSRGTLSGLGFGQAADAYMLEGYIEINQSGYADTVYLWYQRRLVDLVAGTGDTGSTANSLVIPVSAGPKYVDDYYNGVVLEIVGGTGVGKLATVSDYAGSTRVLTVDQTVATTTVFGSQLEVPEESHALITVESALMSMAKPAASYDEKVFTYLTTLVRDLRKEWVEWCSSRTSSSTRVVRTEVV